MNKLYQLRDVEKAYTVGTRPRKGFFAGRTPLLLKALDGIRLDLADGDSLAIVGESGSGKSTLVRLMLGLEAPSDGRLFYQGRELASLSAEDRKTFTREVAFIYQDARGSMNPRMRVRDVLAEPMLLHRLCSEAQVDAKVAELLNRVGLAPEMADRYPAELSGGQVRRVAVARALAVQPRVIFADESVAGLDVSVQAQLLNLLRDLCRDMGLTLVFITHDLGVASYLCTRIAVMYLGRVVEEGPSAEILANPHHPYTRSLLRAFPSFDRPLTASLTGEIPSPINLPAGCRFASRCPDAREACKQTDPTLAPVSDRSSVACLFPLNVQPQEVLAAVS
ncbi:ATP-binding cassette domain-containing protein [Pigmentiphaga aceris]|uniref:ATP-binding cassette domain-containing protein n=1 Tax=Pigmentiphaga aceris TaxID=1940612 RepID=A0A5C0AXM5_9BURK|nr:oligopeptide/dipeptide ABC transporter ATP-binding protein [Pigmentiphaga aceris]QEI06905.1 ATP-binding cassette domain-containing protein [Pigmentiphaga aceris]